LDVTSVYSKESGNIFINVINRHQDKAITADILNTSGTFSGKAQASIVNSDSLKDQFSFDKQSQYAPVVKEVSADNNKITYSFPPHSFTQIKITIKKN